MIHRQIKLGGILPFGLKHRHTPWDGQSQLNKMKSLLGPLSSGGKEEKQTFQKKKITGEDGWWCGHVWLLSMAKLQYKTKHNLWQREKGEKTVKLRRCNMSGKPNKSKLQKITSRVGGQNLGGGKVHAENWWPLANQKGINHHTSNTETEENRKHVKNPKKKELGVRWGGMGGEEKKKRDENILGPTKFAVPIKTTTTILHSRNLGGQATSWKGCWKPGEEKKQKSRNLWMGVERNEGHRSAKHGPATCEVQGWQGKRKQVGGMGLQQQPFKKRARLRVAGGANRAHNTSKKQSRIPPMTLGPWDKGIHLGGEGQKKKINLDDLKKKNLMSTQHPLREHVGEKLHAGGDTSTIIGMRGWKNNKPGKHKMWLEGKTLWTVEA